MKLDRSGSAQWTGGIKDGKGSISTQSGALASHPYGFSSRFEDKAGTNPEELIAAAHAGCFTMAVSNLLGQKGLIAERLDTVAVVTLERGDAGYSIPAIELTLTAKVADVSEDSFQAIAAEAKASCPVSKLLKAVITLDAQLI
jgi:osmotically inducible protein OsmC